MTRILRAALVDGPISLTEHEDLVANDAAGAVVAPAGTPPAIVAKWNADVTKILNSPDALKLAAGQIQDPVVFRALADRMGVDPAHRRLRMVNAVWSAIIVTACGDLTPGTTSGPLGPELMAERISESYDQFRALATIAP